MAHSHSHHHHHHHHPTPGSDAGANIIAAFWLNTAFALLEIAGGFYTNSMAVLSDAVHDLGDSLSLGLAYYFHKKSIRQRDEHFSYGYKRFSLLGAFINSLVLILSSVFIIQEAISRLTTPQQPDTRGMIILAVIGIGMNALAMYRLKKGSSINERVVSLHFLEDVLGWVAVLVGSVVMMVTDVPILDPILSILISLFILYNVYKNLRTTFRILLQGNPENIDEREVKEKLLSISGVKDIHDLHVWTMDGQYNVMTLHLVVEKTKTAQELELLKNEARHCLQHLNLQHVTIEMELEDMNCWITNDKPGHM